METQDMPTNQQANTNTSGDNLIHPGSSPGAYQPVSQPVELVSQTPPVPQQPMDSTPQAPQAPQAPQVPQPEQPLAQPVATPTPGMSTQAPPLPGAEPTPAPINEALPQPAAAVPARPKKRKQRQKRNIKKLLLGTLAVLLLAGGSALAYFMWFKQSDPAPQPAAPQPAIQEVAPLAKDGLFYQVGQKIIKYDVKKKEKTILTDKLPENTEVIDFYTENDTWRAYAQTNSGEEVKIYYLEGGKDPKEVYAKKKSISSVADAKSKQVAYTEVHDPISGPNAVNVNRHFLQKSDEDPVLIAESEPQEAARVSEPENDIKQLNWGVNDISPDGTKVLFRYAHWYGDGPVNGVLEYDIATKKTRLVSKEGFASYDRTGKVIIEATNYSGVGGFDAQTPLRLALRLEAEPGKLKDVLTVNNLDWATVVRQEPIGDYFAVFRRGPQYTPIDHWDKVLFDGLYRVESPSEFKKVEVKDLPSDKFDISMIGEAPGQEDLRCFGVLLTAKSEAGQEDAPVNYRFGKVCSEEGQVLAYEEVEAATAQIMKPL